MFTQSFTNTQGTSKLEDLKNKNPSSSNPDAITTPSLFKADTNTGLFRTITDPANALPPYMQQSSLNNNTITKSSTVSSNTILPVERKVIASDDNNLPAFFIGAQPKKPSTTDSATTFDPSVDNNNNKRDSISKDPSSITITSEASASKEDDIKEQPKTDTTLENPNKEPTTSTEPIPSNDVNTSKTIKVFGYSRNIISLLIDHFSKYGIIEHHIVSNDNVLCIQYETNASANQALKDHGLFFNQNCKIGVILAEQNIKPSLTHQHDNNNNDETDILQQKQQQPKLRRVEHISDDQLFLKKKKGLGSGYAGISASGNRNVSKQDIASKPDIISKYHDIFYEIFFGW
ncbi:hypothetical protein BJ944DRAFT_271036 [Cunninghamella echinulata]|nr:hypothetical protein BJ944DRAFT_271036 [Cunninghamella echinulata]